MHGTYECLYQMGTGKTLKIRVVARSYSQANHKVRKELAKNFKGKTYVVKIPLTFTSRPG